MKKICTFTQTYSDDREELYKFHNNDLSDIYFRNQFDLNIYSFHNCSNEYVNKLLQYEYFKKIKNLKILIYNNISYTDSFEKSLNYINENNFDCLIFFQDDTFTNESEKINDDLIDFIKKQKFDMLNLWHTPENLNISNPELFFKNNKLEIYNTTSIDFVNGGWLAFDDGAYVADVNFIIKKIYDSSFFEKKDVWNAEGYISGKICNNPIQRLTTNNNFYCNYNILGPNSCNKINTLKQLNEKFGNKKNTQMKA